MNTSNLALAGCHRSRAAIQNYRDPTPEIDCLPEGYHYTWVYRTPHAYPNSVSGPDVSKLAPGVYFVKFCSVNSMPLHIILQHNKRQIHIPVRLHRVLVEETFGIVAQHNVGVAVVVPVACVHAYPAAR